MNSIPQSLLGAGYERAVRPVLFRLGGGDPERAHDLMSTTLTRLGRSPALRQLLGAVVGQPHEPTAVAGVAFPGRVGLAAGLDKDGTALVSWANLGFGFAEIGTVTAHPQPGNPAPRLFRLPASEALINRMGFNNRGADALARTLEAAGVRRGNNAAGLPLGISLGKTKIVPPKDAQPDYLRSFELLAPYADYIAVNVSSPNTPGLRGLQDDEALRPLLTALTTAARQQAKVPVPIFVKIAPDLTDAQLDDALTACADAGAAGVIATNTTLTRPALALTDLPTGAQAGGLSGRPLTVRARTVVRRVAASSTLPVIAVGGIMSAADAQAMFDAGASLVQLYTGFIYHGPALVQAINDLPSTTGTGQHRAADDFPDSAHACT